MSESTFYDQLCVSIAMDNRWRMTRTARTRKSWYRRLTTFEHPQLGVFALWGKHRIAHWGTWSGNDAFGTLYNQRALTRAQQKVVRQMIREWQTLPLPEEQVQGALYKGPDPTTRASTFRTLHTAVFEPAYPLERQLNWFGRLLERMTTK